MPIFNQLKQALTSKLASIKTSKSLVRISVKIENVSLDLLAWLKGQNAFPQMFWQQRNQQESFATIGQCKMFNNLDEAEQFSRTHQIKLVGGIQFEGTVHFILPRLLLSQSEQQIQAELFGYGDEIELLLSFLDELQQAQSFQTTTNRLLARQQYCQFADWQRNVQAAIKTIQTGKVDKIVLANATQLQVAYPLSIYDLLAQSRQNNLGCYHFLWAENAQSGFIGSSPERLYLRQGKQLYTEALAGTVAVSQDEQETAENALWLLNDHKNLYENWLVVDDICTNLADCAGDIQVGEAHIKALNRVQHLRRFIQTELSHGVSDREYLKRIHPTAAVAGLPRSQAITFIQQHEPFKRGWYAGTLGYFSPEQAEFCVTLRSALIQGKQMTLYSGAGIVAESDPYAEWQEIERKALTMAELILSHSQ